jgi:MurNAc alpha-1-phosphate uridylyltransferase
LPRLGPGPFLVVNADVLTDFDPSALRLDGAHSADGAVGADCADGALLLVPNPDHNPRGDFALDARGRVRAEGTKLTYGGNALLTPALFASCAPGPRPLKPVLDAAIARGALRGMRYDGPWIDVGTPGRLERARAMFAR